MISIPRHEPLVITRRNQHTECVHWGSVAVVDIHGKVLASAGDPYTMVFSRSTLKPFQALPFLQDQGPNHFQFTTEQTAILGASHSGEDIHSQTVSEILNKAQSTEKDLGCGCHLPLIYHENHLPPQGKLFDQTHHNCSGKHSGFLAYCCMHHLDKTTYLASEHPLQQRIKATVASVCDLTENDLWTGIDGCSAPNLGMPLNRLAMMWARLGAAHVPGQTSYNRGLQTIRDAMLKHPEIHSGTGRSELAINQSGPWLVKSGADGLHVVALPEQGLGIAIKISDGHMGAVAATTIETLQQLGLADIDQSDLPLQPFRNPLIKNWKGQTAGELISILALKRPHSSNTLNLQ